MTSRLKSHDSQFKQFFRAQFSAFIGGMCDYTLMILLTEFAGVFYPFAIACSAICGAFINFSVNRYWTFKQTDLAKWHQLQKFVFVVMGSIALKSTGTYLLSESTFIDYKISRILVDAVVSIGFNFTLQKYWVFKAKTA